MGSHSSPSSHFLGKSPATSLSPVRTSQMHTLCSTSLAFSHLSSTLVFHEPALAFSHLSSTLVFHKPALTFSHLSSTLVFNEPAWLHKGHTSVNRRARILSQICLMKTQELHPLYSPDQQHRTSYAPSQLHVLLFEPPSLWYFIMVA